MTGLDVARAIGGWLQGTLIAFLPLAIGMIAAPCTDAGFGCARAQSVGAAESAPAASGTAGPSAASSPVGDPATLLAQILRRPLFNPSRQPPALPLPPPPPPPVVDAAPPAWDWRVTGIMISPDRSEAIFMRDDLKLVVGLGEEIDGWTVVDVRVDAVDVEGEDGRKTLHPQAVPVVADKATPGKNGKVAKLPKQPSTLPSLAQARTGLLVAAKKSAEEEAKRPKRQIRPRGQS